MCRSDPECVQKFDLFNKAFFIMVIYLLMHIFVRLALKPLVSAWVDWVLLQSFISDRDEKSFASILNSSLSSTIN